MVPAAVPRQRWLLATAVALLVGIFMACMGMPREAEYPQRVRFIGKHGTNFEIVVWSQDPNNPQPCPLVIHLPDGDYSDKELSDPKLLAARGWVANEPDNGLTPLTYRRGNLVVQVAHRGGVLELVNVNALTCPEPQEGTVSIEGKLLTLPVSDDEMVRLLGQPFRRR